VTLPRTQNRAYPGPVPQGETPPGRNPKGRGTHRHARNQPHPATAQLTAHLGSLTHGPYADASSVGAADLAAETIRYLNHAAAKGGITDPATVADLTSSLATATYRLPQLLNTISEWLRAETTAGRIVDDHRRPPDQLTARIRATITHR
jgi:hypothetical protein